MAATKRATKAELDRAQKRVVACPHCGDVPLVGGTCTVQREGYAVGCGCGTSGAINPTPTAAVRNWNRMAKPACLALGVPV